MSTRAQIVFEAFPVAVYRHSDGYPDGPHGVLAGLLPVLRDMHRYRGWEPQGMAAQVVHRFVADYRADYADRVVSGCLEMPSTLYGGFCVEPFDGELHGDLDYVYLVRPDCVHVRQPLAAFWSGEARLYNTKLVARVDYHGSPYAPTRYKTAGLAQRMRAAPALHALTRTSRPRSRVPAPAAAAEPVKTRRVIHL
jgi:hypothetical protein